MLGASWKSYRDAVVRVAVGDDEIEECGCERRKAEKIRGNDEGHTSSEETPSFVVKRRRHPSKPPDSALDASK